MLKELSACSPSGWNTPFESAATPGVVSVRSELSPLLTLSLGSVDQLAVDVSARDGCQRHIRRAAPHGHLFFEVRQTEHDLNGRERAGVADGDWLFMQLKS